MPKSTKKSPIRTAKTSAKKPKVVKAKAKPKAKMKATVKAGMNTKGTRRGFMWKVLEQKQQQKKDSVIPGERGVNPEERFRPVTGQNGYARFHGPRRRVG